jgi:hypothetical protein
MTRLLLALSPLLVAGCATVTCIPQPPPEPQLERDPVVCAEQEFALDGPAEMQPDGSCWLSTIINAPPAQVHAALAAPTDAG